MIFKDLIVLIHIPCLESTRGKGVAKTLRSEILVVLKH